MILNSLGFVNQRLYLVSKFFEDKPVDRLISAGIEAEHLNDDSLGRALDSLYEHSVTSLFVLATVQTDSDEKEASQHEQAQMLTAYKVQHSVERSFCFLKNPGYDGRKL